MSATNILENNKLSHLTKQIYYLDSLHGTTQLKTWFTLSENESNETVQNLSISIQEVQMILWREKIVTNRKNKKRLQTAEASRDKTMLNKATQE